MLLNIGAPSLCLDAGHFDSANWRGVNSVNAPIWLLSVMAKSGLFDRWEIKTGQMITYFYDSDLGGGFTYWPGGPDKAPARIAAPYENTCVIADNSKVYHRRESNGPVDQRDYPGLRGAEGGRGRRQLALTTRPRRSSGENCCSPSPLN